MNREDQEWGSLPWVALLMSLLGVLIGLAAQVGWRGGLVP